jgi:type VI secretion system protein ImpD
LPSDDGELGAEVRPRQPDPEAPFNGGAGLEGGLRDRLLSDVIELNRPPVGDTSNAEIEQLGVAEELAAWFGSRLAGLDRDKGRILCALDCDIALIDGLLSDQINAILHAPAFQRLESTWRGLRYVASVASDIDKVKVRLLAVSWNELVRDLERAADFDQSQIFNKLYTEELDMPGGQPFGILIADYAVQHHRTPDHPTDDVAALKSLSEVAAAAFVPVVLGVSPSMFQLDSFRELGRPIDLGAVFQQPPYQRWIAMRRGEEMRFIALTLPRILMRLPYGDEGPRRDGFCFREDVTAGDGSGYLWGNAAFAFASVVLRAYANYGWFADIRGAPRDEVRGGLVIDLPVPWFRTDRPKTAIKPSTECIISDTHEKVLAELGFIALRKSTLTEFSVFNETPSLQIPMRFDRVTATANARISAMLQYILCVSRFAHFIKVMGREYAGSLKTAAECEERLQRWLIDYCDSGNSSPETKAKYPLREGKVEVRDVPGKPGYYSCTIHLQPHFQLDDIAASIRLVTELTQSAKT